MRGAPGNSASRSPTCARTRTGRARDNPSCRPADGFYVEGVGVRVDEDALELAVDDAGDHPAEAFVLIDKSQIRPYLGAGIAQPHGRDVTGIDIGVGAAVFVLGVMDGGVQGVREAFPEHLRELGMGDLRRDGFDGRVHGGRDEGAFLHRRTVGV
jgi:hypothetical protein